MAAVLSLAAAARAGEIRGRILIGERPASGVTISAVPYETPEAEARRLARKGVAPRPLGAVATRGDGTFALAVSASAGTTFRLLAEGAGVVASWVGGTYDASESDDLGEHALARAETLAGRVVSATGTPIAGALVRVLPRGVPFAAGPFAAGDPEVAAVSRTVVSGADGVFRATEASADGNRLTIVARSYAAASLTGVRAGAMPRPIALGLGAIASGTVLRADGKTPAEGALVRYEGEGLETPWVEAAADGTFQLADLPSRAGTVVVEGGEAGIGEAATGALPLPPGRRLSLALSPPPTLEGRVVDALTRAPVARARITVEDGLRTRTARSGPDGRYEVRGLLPQRLCRLRADEPRYTAYLRDRILLATAETQHLDVPLRRGASLSVRVVDEAGRPVAGALGRLMPGGGGGFAGRLRGLRAADHLVFRTGADGTFKATRLAPGEDRVLSVVHPDFEPRTSAGLALAPGGSKALTLTLRRGLTLVGRVRDEAGRPIADAEVEVTPGRGFGIRVGRGFAAGRGAALRPKAVTGSDGRFEVKGLSEGDYAVVVSKEGFADHRLDRVPVDAEHHDPIEIALGAGAAIGGTVSRKDGRGAEGYWVRAVVTGGGGGPGLGPLGAGDLRPTGPDGTFAIAGLHAGESYDLVVLGPDGVGARREGVQAPAADVEVVVPGPGRITGRVVDAQSLAPVADFQIDFGPDRSSGRGGFAGGAGRAVGRAVRAMLGGPAGGAQPVYSDDGTFVLEDVPPGTWEVVAQSKGYQTARVGGVTVDEGGTREAVEVRLSQGNAIRGHVLDATTGTPVLDASVTLQRAGGGGRALALLMGESDARTDADGGFVIDGAGPGSYTVVAQHPDYAQGTALVEVKEGAARADLRLVPGGVLGGVVLSETSTPLPGAAVSLGSGGGFGRGGGMAGPGGQSTMTDDAGHFRFTHVTAGRYTLAASLRGHQAAPADVLLQPGESRDNVVLSLAAGTRIRGVVSGLPAALRGNVGVSASGPDGYFASARAGADGAFELTGAPAGPVNLRATAGDFGGTMRSATAQVDVAEGQSDVQAQIVFEDGLALGGTVTRSGQPVGDATVTAALAGSGRMASAHTTGAGAYRLEGLSPGSYSVGVMPSGGGAPQRQSIDLSDDATLDFAIPVASVVGAVVEAGTKQPIADAYVQASAKEGGGTAPGRGAATDSNGRFSLEDLDPSPYVVSVRRSGFQADSRDVTPVEGGGPDVVFELLRGEGIGIEVRDAAFGLPLRAVQVRATDAQGVAVYAGGVPLDSDGRGEVPSLPPGAYTLAVYAAGYAPAIVGASAPAPRVLVPLGVGGALEIHAGASTLAHGTARAQIVTSEGQPYPFSFFASQGQLTLAAPIRRLENLGPGHYVLQVDGAEGKPFDVQQGGLSVLGLP